MPASLIVAYLGYTGVAAAVATFAIRLVTTYVVSNLIAKRSQADMGGAGAGGTGTQQIGNRIQLPPATDNKIPVVYGSAYMKPILTDAKISTDQKTMWHVMVFSEAMDSDAIGTFSFGDIYWGDKKLVFGDGADLTKVTAWINSDGTTEDQPNGLINVYTYRDGSERPINSAFNAYSANVLADTAISSENRWTSAKKMTKLVFAVVKIQYNQEKGITGLADVTAVINNTLNKPGSVIRNYLNNTRYGAAVPESKINLTSLAALDAYSDETISYTPSGGGAAQTSPRYRINGPVDTTKVFLDNLVDMTESCDSWLQWDETLGKWAAIANRSYTDLDPTGAQIRRITSSDIIGGIDITPIDLNATYNRVDVQFPNTKIKDQPGYYSVEVTDFPNITTYANEAVNVLNLALPYTNNIIQAQYIGARRLLQSREDLTVAFSMNFSGIQIDAGDVIGIQHEIYGWDTATYGSTGKLFRVQQVQETKTEDGTLYSQIVAVEYNDAVYDDDNIALSDFTPSLNTGITNPTLIATPNPVTITDIVNTATTPNFTVNATIPTTGTTLGMEFWYGTTSTFSNAAYNLWSTELPIGASVWPKASTSSVRINSLADGIYYWRARAVGARSKSGFSTATSITWTPRFISGVIGQDVIVNFTPPTHSLIRNGPLRKEDFTSLNNVVAQGQIGGALVNYVDALTDSDEAFTFNTWRIGNASFTGPTTEGVITATNIVFDYEGITVVDGTAKFPIPYEMTAEPASITIPVRYKDAAGNVYQSPAATVNFYFKDNLDGGVQVSFKKPVQKLPNRLNAYGDLIPDYTTAEIEAYGDLNGVLIPYVDAQTDTDPLFTTGTWRIATTAVNNYNTTTANSSTAVVIADGISTNPGTIFRNTASGAVLPFIYDQTKETATITIPVRFKDYDGNIYNASPATQTLILVDQGDRAPTTEFTVSGLVFKKLPNNTFDPPSASIRLKAEGWLANGVSWITSGTSTSTISTTVITNDTILVSPSTASNVITLTATASSPTETTTRQLVIQVVQDGVTGSRGFVPLAFIPIVQSPITATQGQLTSAWVAATGLTPVNLDGGSFKHTTSENSRSYTFYSATGLWTAATLEVPGDLIATGTIRANAMAANQIFTNNLASTQNSTTATFGNNTAPGYWLDGISGNARFGGNVSIGRNLTVDGLIEGGNLASGVVTERSIAPGAITADVLGTGTNSIISTAVVASTVGFGQNAWGYYVQSSSIQPNFLHLDTIGYHRILVPTADYTANKLNLRATINIDMAGTVPAGGGFYIIMYLNGFRNAGVINFTPSDSAIANLYPPDQGAWYSDTNNTYTPTAWSKTVYSWWRSGSLVNSPLSTTIQLGWNGAGSYGLAGGVQQNFTQFDNNYLVLAAAQYATTTNGLANTFVSLSNISFTLEKIG